MSGISLALVSALTLPPPAVVEYVGFVDGGSPAGAAASSFTFNSASIGGPGLIVLGISVEGSNAVYTLSSVTVNAAATTTITNSAPVLGGNYTSASLFQQVVASGTTANIVVNFSAVVNRLRVGIWRITNYNSASPISSNTTSNAAGGTSISTTLTAMQIGAAVVGVCTTGDVTPHTWTNLTENYDSAIATSVVGTGTEASGASAINNSTSNLIITTSAASTGQALILTAAAWR